MAGSVGLGIWFWLDFLIDPGSLGYDVKQLVCAKNGSQLENAATPFLFGDHRWFGTLDFAGHFYRESTCVGRRFGSSKDDPHCVPGLDQSHKSSNESSDRVNYRHLYHAGNFADIVKHIILTRVIVYMQRKEAAFRVLDTHAGTGVYDLSSEEAQKTGEHHKGIAKLLESIGSANNEQKALIEPYLKVVEGLNQSGEISAYPGSPLIARKLFRRQDRLTALELHDEDYASLAKHFDGDYQARITHLDGWLGLKSHLPPKERRGIVLVDPPFEAFHEFFNILNGLKEAHTRFAGGTYLLWYPVKNRKACGEFRDELRALKIPAILDVTLEIRKQTKHNTFDGTGMVIVNPPYVLESELSKLLPFLCKTLEEKPGSGRFVIDWITPAA